MVFNIPTTQKRVIDRASTDVQQALPETNPFFRNSFLGAIIYSFAGRIFDFYLQLNILIREMFVDTATIAFLERWGIYKGITRNAATRAVGRVTATGTVTTNIPIGTQLTDAEGSVYVTTASASISSTTVGIISLTRSGSIVTAITSSPHRFGSTQSLTIASAVETEYNGLQSITVTGEDSFTYTIATTPTSPATGTITASANQASLTIQSVEFGSNQNLTNGTQLTFATPISGANDTAIVQFSEISGGTDLESDENLRTRILEIYQNPISHFNRNDIISKAKSVAGVTRVFVYSSGEDFGNAISVDSITRSGDVATVTTDDPHGLENGMLVNVVGANENDYNITARILVISDTEFAYIVQNDPDTPATGTIELLPTVPLGQAIVYFTRDNDTNIIPTTSAVNTTTNVLRTIQPANTANVDFIIRAPAPVVVDFVFTALSPNTATMQAAITANLEALFREQTVVGQDLKQFAFNSAIFQTIDPETGDTITDFTLSDPSGDVDITAGQLPVLGGITFP
jgi:uncharacterized phage protein gp47/JayE